MTLFSMWFAVSVVSRVIEERRENGMPIKVLCIEILVYGKKLEE